MYELKQAIEKVLDVGLKHLCDDPGGIPKLYPGLADAILHLTAVYDRVKEKL